MGQEGVKAEIAQVGWLAGSWSCEVNDGTWHEHWSPPVGGTMQGHGKEIKGDKTTFMEYMSIEPSSDGGLTMWMLLGAPSRGRKMGVPFRLTAVTATSCVWTNPSNVFPREIGYRQTDGGIHCRILGMRGGCDTAIDFNFEPLLS